jgi:hypothetical protein
LEMRVSRTLSPSWPRTSILPISASRVALITGVSHGAWLDTESKRTSAPRDPTRVKIERGQGKLREPRSSGVRISRGSKQPCRTV